MAVIKHKTVTPERAIFHWGMSVTKKNLLNKDLGALCNALRHMAIYISSELHRILSVRINSKRIWLLLFRSGEGERGPIR